MRIAKAVIIVVVLVVFAVVNVDLVFSQDDQELEEMAIDEELEQELKWLKPSIVFLSLDSCIKHYYCKLFPIGLERYQF